MVAQADRDCLTSNGFTDVQIDEIAGHPEGNLNITELVRVFSSLTSAPYSFTVPQLYQLANKPNGHAILGLILDNIDALFWMETSERIVEKAVREDGIEEIEELATQGWEVMDEGDDDYPTEPQAPTFRDFAKPA